ncbi:PREDICTED: nucleolar protein of 40 kDa-like [Ceratosolen solmsi marchali]|uniref:Nucleolar protein of 40 kDa-like n=1 Tax=Ceratosolen solmsi marchali TaxID=326594 RepID=A0AAJ6YIA6_9HYME|nr:PREDICTED: nucleolar protein of 40 kDa-like [Ceratosolen solmsi marchali]
MVSCKVNQIFLGEISSVQNYGAFVKIPGCAQQGLIHRSQVSSVHVDDVTDVLQRGERIWCKIISIGEDGKIALSMKLVNQGNGKDLDPAGVQLQLDEQKRKSLNKREDRKVIILDAVFKTTCSKCKTPGHLAKDCFASPDGKKYELLPEIEDEKAAPNIDIKDECKSKEKKHKSKKSKKRKRSKSSKQDDSESENNDYVDEKSKKKKRKLKEQKHKKKKHHSSSNNSDSSDNSVSKNESKKHSKKCKHSRIRHSD